MSVRKSPFRKLTRQLTKHDAFRQKNLSLISVIYLKLLMQEPFRIWENWRSRDKIHGHQLSKDPVFIIGHWRSGTSLMQYLLGCDPQFAYLNKFQAVFPEIFLHGEKLLKPLAERLPQTLKLIKDARNMSVNLDWNSPSEVEIALTTMISETSPHWGHIFPKNGEGYFNKFLFFKDTSEAEIHQWKQDYSWLINKISLKNKGRQVLVKSPANTSRIKKLLEMYPRARFIYLHRNPYDIFYSAQKLWHTMVDNLALEDFSQPQIEQKIVDIYKKLLYHYLDQRALIPKNKLVEIRFEDFIKQPLNQLFLIYEQLRMDDFQKVLPHFRSFLAGQPEERFSSYNYEDRTIDWLNREWGFAFDEWNYPMLNVVSSKDGYHATG
jgi:hypothetical protein